MKINHIINALGKHIWTIELDESELATYIPSDMEKEMKRLFDYTNKTSDGLMYLSEVVKSIEDQSITTKEE